MLKSIHIENFAVIRESDISFPQGFSVITGETGAGKSVLIDSVSAVLGGKTKKEIIRTGCEKASVSAVFSDIGEVIPEDSEISPDENGELYVVRSIDSQGRSQSKINGRSVSLAVHRSALSGAVSIHGQNDSLSLLSEDSHLNYVDSFAGDRELLLKYREKYNEVVSLRRRIDDLKKDEKEKTRLAELLRLQLDDINGARLRDGEEEALNDRLLKLKNAEKINKHARFIVRTLYKSEKGVPAYELVKRASASIEAISEYFPEPEKYTDLLTKLSYGLEEVALVAEDLCSDFGEDPEKELDSVQTRLDRIEKLRKKYGDSVGEILRYRDETEKRLKELESSEEIIGRLSEKLASAEREAVSLGEELTRVRREAAGKIESAILSELEYLEMPRARFRVSVKKLYETSGAPELTRDGTDRVNFMFSANTGEELKPLSEVASGGELSRVMLALRTISTVPSSGETLVFDEIDTGVSGRTSHKIGIRLKRLSRTGGTQVICVTHSAQIAAEADAHYLIKKTENGGRTETSVSLLDRQGRINELSRIMGGVNITEKIRQSAEEMLTDSENRAETYNEEQAH
ncbi:MAG: DNA repair protein RecN [Clostridia bacterium]|nr:DNA repair protein RecN [Clostridia bacterium]